MEMAENRGWEMNMSYTIVQMPKHYVVDSGSRLMK